VGSVKVAQVGIGAIALLLAGIVGFRALRGGAASPPPPSPSAPEKEQKPAGLSAPLNLSVPAGSLALSWVRLLNRESEYPPGNAAGQELLRSEERQIADELKQRLGKNPALWTEVLDALSKEDPRMARKIVAALPDAVGESGEPELLRLMKSARHREVRKSAITLLGPRNSGNTLGALLAAAQQDPDSGVRYQALSELARRQGKAATPAEAATIDQTLRLRAQVEPDVDVRNFALRVTGQPAPNPAGFRPK